MSTPLQLQVSDSCCALEIAKLVEAFNDLARRHAVFEEVMHKKLTNIEEKIRNLRNQIGMYDDPVPDLIEPEEWIARQAKMHNQHQKTAALYPVPPQYVTEYRRIIL